MSLAASWRMQPVVAAGLPPPEAKISPCSRTAEAGDFSSSKREMVGKDHGSCWEAAGPADRERTLRDQPEWART